MDIKCKKSGAYKLKSTSVAGMGELVRKAWMTCASVKTPLKLQLRKGLFQ